MEIIARHGREDLAVVNVARLEDGSLIEFVESLQPPLPRRDKWVLIVSSLKGCPVNCRMCDAGGTYAGRLSTAEILDQIDSLVSARFPDRVIPVPKFKVQFARMGEPALNDAVLEVLRILPQRYHAPGLMPCISSILPRGRESFFDRLRTIKDELYGGGWFQMQFSLHTTHPKKRAELIDYPILDFAEAARLGEKFYHSGDRKIALNFAAAKGYPVDGKVLLRYFDPTVFIVKLTPLNPTEQNQLHGLQTQIDPHTGAGSEGLRAELEAAGYEVILSLGEPEEDLIGSNCGQYANRYAAKLEGMQA